MPTSSRLRKDIWRLKSHAPSNAALCSGCQTHRTRSNCSVLAALHALLLALYRHFECGEQEGLIPMSTIIYLNGTIYTMDEQRPRAQAMAIDSTSGRILAIGENDEVRRMGGQHTELIDLRGKTV